MCYQWRIVKNSTLDFMKPFVLYCLTVLLCTLILGFGFVCENLTQTFHLKTSQVVFIHKGMSLKKIAHSLEKHHIIPNKWLFILCHTLTKETLKAGEYKFKGQQSYATIRHALVWGHVVHHKVTLPEGLTTPLIQERIEHLMGACPAMKTEGLLLPETYDYTWTDTCHTLLKRMERAQKKFLMGLGPLPSPLQSMRQVIILASIVEKESALLEEQPHIAAVFLNRLKKGMPLQADSTILYALNITGREPVHKELKTPTPYNTYAYKGLPPGPICNPGKSAILAVMKPIVSDNLYFVANGTRGHTFSKTLKEHQKHHNLWRRLRKLSTKR